MAVVSIQSPSVSTTLSRLCPHWAGGAGVGGGGSSLQLTSWSEPAGHVSPPRGLVRQPPRPGLPHRRGVVRRVEVGDPGRRAHGGRIDTGRHVPQVGIDLHGVGNGATREEVENGSPVLAPPIPSERNDAREESSARRAVRGRARQDRPVPFVDVEGKGEGEHETVGVGRARVSRP